MSLKVKIVTLKNIAMKLYKYFASEARRGRLYRSISSPEKRTKHALGISNRTFSRWNSEDCNVSINTQKSRGRKSKIDNFDKDVIIMEIHRMLDGKELLTLKKLKIELRQNRDIDVSKTTLWKIVRGAGFTFRKNASGRNVLCERPHLVTLRSKYLRQIREVRKQNYDVVYIDETWINAHHTCGKEWQTKDGTVKRTVPSSKGKRLIIAHSGSRRNGLLKNVELMFVSKSKDNQDYHNEMNGQIFRKWIEETVIPSLDVPSCLVMDNAAYHNAVATEDKIPTSSSTKDEIKIWLTKEHIPFTEMHMKPELLSFVKNANKTKTFHIDKIIQEHGHMCLRLPPYHPHLNPIELVWARVKGKVASSNSTFKLSDVRQIACAALSDIDKHYWIQCEDHVLNEEETYWQNDGLRFLQPTTVISLSDSSDSS